MNLLVYDDNPDFGGHQIMACRGIEALAAEPALNVVCMLNPDNRKLTRRLSETNHINLLPAPVVTRRLQGLCNHFSSAAIHALARQFIELKIDRMLCIQGEIEGSSQALLAARKAGIHCISYLANPHSMQQMGATLGGLRDRTNRYLFALPDRYITLSESMKALLRNRGATAPIDIVPNGIPAPPDAPLPTPRSSLTLGLLGRIEFNQKQQDFMVRTFCDYPEAFQNCRLLIAGDGPDRNRLAGLIADCPRSTDITLLPWQAAPESFYAQIDLLLLPSRFEGVPLVMLEALARGIPVVASRRDGMQDLLPDQWTFETENAQALAATFCDARNSPQQLIAKLRERVLSEMSLEAFQTHFAEAVARA